MSPFPLFTGTWLRVKITTFPHWTTQDDTFQAGLLPWPG